MATTVGHESDITKLVQDLLHLEHDAIAAYDSAVDKLESEAFKAKVAAFETALGDEQRHRTWFEDTAAAA